MSLISSSLSSNPLFSTIVTIYLLVFLYLPHFFLYLFLSPVFISTLVLLFCLLRLGVSQQLTLGNDHNQVESPPQPEPEIIEQGSLKLQPIQPNCTWVETQLITEYDPEIEPEQINSRSKTEIEPDPHCQILNKPDPNRYHHKKFIKWDVGAPLEVIYEAFEGDEGDEDEYDENDAFDEEIGREKIERYPSLSRYYPESGSELDSDSGSDSSESSWGKWDEDEGEGLIEIALDYNCEKQGINKLIEVVHVVVDDDEDDNLIEIDISPTRKNFGLCSGSER